MDVAAVIHASKKNLSEALARLSRVAPSKSSNPVFSCALIEPGSGELVMTATNLELEVRVIVPAEVGIGAVPTLVNVHLLTALVAKLPGEQVELSTDGAKLHVHGGGVRSHAATGDPTDFPPLRFPDGEFDLDATELARSIEAVSYAASKEGFQAAFRGVLFNLTSRGLRLVASDGFRLALRDTAVEGPEKRFLIPRRALNEVASLLVEGETVRLSVDDATATFVMRGARVRVKLLDTEFPDYERVIPKDTRLEFVASAERLRSAVDRVLLFSDSQANNRVEWVVSENRLRVEAESDLGAMTDHFDIQQGGSEPAMILAFNGRYVMDALKNIEGDVKFELSTPTAPAKITSLGDGGLLAVVVPLRV